MEVKLKHSKIDNLWYSKPQNATISGIKQIYNARSQNNLQIQNQIGQSLKKWPTGSTLSLCNGPIGLILYHRNGDTIFLNIFLYLLYEQKSMSIFSI